VGHILDVVGLLFLAADP
jgi:hypothetical protein